MPWRAYCGDYQRTLLLTSGWQVPGAHYLALVNGPLRTSTCIVTRQPSVQRAWRPTTAALADIRCQRTMPSACGGALPASSAVRTEPASVPVSFGPPGCSPTTDHARFGSVVHRLPAQRREFHDQQGCGILSVRTLSRTAGSATEITAACRHPLPVWLRSRPAKHSSCLGRRGRAVIGFSLHFLEDLDLG
jgi:hypothetical protein